MKTEQRREELHSEIWKNIQAFELPFGEEYLRQKYNWSPVFSRLMLQEYRRFILLSLFSEKPVTPSIDLDEVWHTHILHTRSYKAMCRVLGRDIHHDPGMPNQRGDFQGQYRDTLKYYSDVFGHEAPPAAWPRPHTAGEKGTMEKAYEKLVCNAE